jgi:hypothetical protein
MDRKLALSDRYLDGGLGVQARGVESGNRDVGGVQQQLDLGAAEDHRLSAALDHLIDGVDVPSARLFADDADDELLIDDVVYRSARRSSGIKTRSP